MVTVYFATNRAKDAGAPGGFGAEIAGPTATDVLYAQVDVSGTDLIDESSGRLEAIIEEAQGSFSTGTVNEIIAAEKNLLVFVHGFANSFEDAIKRAAFNAEWLRASGIADADTTVIAFSWPSAGDLLAAPPHLPPDAYFADQARAGKSAFHLAHFLNVVDNLRNAFLTKNPGKKIFLLAHSMGNYALQGAVQWWFDNHGSNDPMFDETVLAAADEIYDSFESAHGMRLSNLPKLTRRITIYHSRIDVAMYVSTTLNLDQRLGFDGPDDKTDARIYPPTNFRIGDCTGLPDYDRLNPPDATHQYYRRSPLARADISSVFGGNPQPPGGLFKLS